RQSMTSQIIARRHFGSPPDNSELGGSARPSLCGSSQYSAPKPVSSLRYTTRRHFTTRLITTRQYSTAAQLIAATTLLRSLLGGSATLTTPPHDTAAHGSTTLHARSALVRTNHYSASLLLLQSRQQAGRQCDLLDLRLQHNLGVVNLESPVEIDRTF